MELLQVTPEYHARVWGGQQLKATQPGETPIGEAWLVHEGNRVTAGSFAGQTLLGVTERLGESLLGARAFSRTGSRFPLLIKILDCADWLSVQVHPNDAQAVQLEGAGQFGKTEAWHILSAAPGAELIAGVKPGTTPEALARAIRDGSVLEVSQYHTAQAGDTVMMPAGTMHALGPGFLLYEVQQTSDITYRVFDWNRPASAGRALHIEQSVAVTRADASGEPHAMPALAVNDAQELVACPYFSLELVQAQGAALEADTRGQSFHAITAIDGLAEVTLGDQRVRLYRFETVIVPAHAGAYQLHGTFKALRSSVPA